MKRNILMAFTLALSCVGPAWASAITTISVSGQTQVAVSGDPLFKFFAGASCSGSGGTTASCDETSTYSGLDNTSAIARVEAVGSAEASFGHLAFMGHLQSTYFGGASPAPCCVSSNTLAVGGSASDTDFISYSGLAPSFIQLSFTAFVSFQNDGPGIEQSYSVTVGNNAPWTFLHTSGLFTYTATFPVDPSAGSVLLQLSGTSRGSIMNEDGFDNSSSSRIDLGRVVLLDANMNPIPEPSGLLLCAAGLIGLAGFRRAKTQRNRKGLRGSVPSNSSSPVGGD